MQKLFRSFLPERAGARKTTTGNRKRWGRPIEVFASTPNAGLYACSIWRKEEVMKTNSLVAASNPSKLHQARTAGSNGLPGLARTRSTLAGAVPPVCLFSDPAKR